MIDTEVDLKVTKAVPLATFYYIKQLSTFLQNDNKLQSKFTQDRQKFR